MELRLLDIEEAPRTDVATCAAMLSERCQHVSIDGRLTSLGYRFYPMPSSEVPSFFCKRFVAGDRTGAVTLLAGFDPSTGEPVLEDCRSAREASRRIAGARAGWWLVRITFGARMLTIDELTSEFPAGEPAAFASFAAELDALGLTTRSACPICRDDGA